MNGIPGQKSEQAGNALLTLLDGIDLTQAELASEDVHDIRVAIKKTRAWLKLCRGLTGKTTAAQQLVLNLRELSRALAAQRDRDVARLTLAKLVQKYPGKKAQHLVAVLHQALARHPPAQTPVAPERATLAQIRQDLLQLQQQVVTQPIQAEVLQRTFMKMCTHGEVALDSGACNDLHAWRKLVKTLGYQLTMVEVNVPGLTKLHARLSRLGSKLGDVHDLCFLQVMIEELAEQAQLEMDLAPVFKRISKERTVLLAAVRKLNRHVCHTPLLLKWAS